MALSDILPDILQFDCYVENDIARNATKHFAGILGDAFNQYKKLWNNHLKLIKHCEDANFKIPFQLFKSDKCNNNAIITHNTSNVSSNCSNISVCSYGDADSSKCDITSDLHVTPSKYKSNDQQTKENELFKSPVLAERPNRFRKIKNTNHPILRNFNQSVVNPSLPVKDDICVSTKSTENKEECIVNLEESVCLINDINLDQIECTPVHKLPRKLGISKLYNVDTQLMENGKKLRQSKLVLHQSPNTPQRTTSFFQRYQEKADKFLKSHKKDTDKNTKLDSTDQDIFVDEIISNSPSKYPKSNLKMKNFKRIGEEATNVKDESGTSNKYMNKNDITKLDAKPVNQSTFNPTCMSTQLDDSSSKNIKSNLSAATKETKKFEMKGSSSQGEKRGYSNLSTQIVQDNTSVNDETYFPLGDVAKKISNENTSEISKENIQNNTLPEFVPPHKKLKNTFNMLFDKMDPEYDNKPSKKQSERAKMNGVRCWECKEYYGNLGLSEEERKIRQNKCSRHRTNFNERGETPAGFWDHLFPETFTSTYGD